MTTLRAALARIGRFLAGLLSDREPSRQMPAGYVIRSSDGEGGRVISSGHPGGGS